MTLRPVAGFEHSGYAWLHGRLVWARPDGHVDHPRHLHRPWQPARLRVDARRAGCAARALVASLPADAPGLLGWLAQGRSLPFPLHLAAARFDAVRAALDADDPLAFAQAAPGLIGLGPGLTPSGDDFIGGALFALALAPRRRWRPHLTALHAALRARAASHSNPISAALLDDLMRGAAYRPLHELAAALDAGGTAADLQPTLRIGATSGADLAAGLLLAFSTHPDLA